MNSKKRMHTALEGRPVDRMPVTVLYSMLYFKDHFAELTGRDSREMHQWLSSSPEEYYRLYATMLAKAPFEALQPHGAAPRADREATAFESVNGGFFRIDKRTGKRALIEARVAGLHYKSNSMITNLSPHIGVATLASPMEVGTGRAEQAACRYQSQHGYISNQDLTSHDLSSIVQINELIS